MAAVDPQHTCDFLDGLDGCERCRLEDSEDFRVGYSIGFADGKRLPRRGAIACYRLRTGEPERKWNWQNGEPSQGVRDLADLHKWDIEYAYSDEAVIRATEQEPPHERR